MSVYVERRGGSIVGVFANPQEGIPEEVLADDAPEVVAFLSAGQSALVAEQNKHATLAAQVGSVVAYCAADKASTNRTANQRDQFENKVCDVLTMILKRMTQRD